MTRDDERRAAVLRYAQNIIDGKEPHDAAPIARGLEDEIERRGLQERYIGWFYKHVCTDDMNSRQEVFAILRATPEQRAAAFIAAMEQPS